jgi:DNA-binding response OmpR family regulator
VTRNKILVVEDEAGIRFGLRDFIESSGYELEEADSGPAPAGIFQPARPDAAILDFGLAHTVFLSRSCNPDNT